MTVLDSMPHEQQLKARKAIEEVEQEAGWHALRALHATHWRSAEGFKTCLQALDRMELMPDLHELAAFMDEFSLPR